jgi:hypothetical protein
MFQACGVIGRHFLCTADGTLTRIAIYEEQFGDLCQDHKYIHTLDLFLPFPGIYSRE